MISLVQLLQWTMATGAPAGVVTMSISRWTEDDNDSNAGTADGSGKKRSSTRKIVCPVCGQSVRAARDAYIKCGYCDLLMV